MVLTPLPRGEVIPELTWLQLMVVSLGLDFVLAYSAVYQEREVMRGDVAKLLAADDTAEVITSPLVLEVTPAPRRAKIY